jgi:hypothetical protein
MSQHCTFLNAGDLTALVGDDTPRGAGGRQYSGLWALWHARSEISPFQGAYAGLIAGAHRGTAPTLEVVNATTARLVKAPCTETGFATAVGTYTLVAPHYIDYTFTVTFADDACDLPNPVEYNWCSYMASPREIGLHFIENGVWTVFTPSLHGEGASVLPAGLDDTHRAPWERRTGEARFAEQENFWHSFSGRTFDFPFYFGAVGPMIYLLMADQHRDFRIFASPSGAGLSAIPGQMSPAWDFSWLVWDPRPGDTRTLHARLAWFPREGYLLNRAIWQEWETFREACPIQS